MSTESETKSAGVPAGATHVCTECGQYWSPASQTFATFPDDWPGTVGMVGVEIDPDCPCGDLRPIAKAGPAPTTAAPAEQPPGGVVDPVTCPGRPEPHERGYLCDESAAPAEQLSGKVETEGFRHFGRRRFSRSIYPRPAEQPGKAADPRPAQPQAPAEPWRSPGMGVYLHELLSAAYDRVPLPFAALRQDLVEAAEHFREHPPEVAAPVREERDRLAEQLAEARKSRDYFRTRYLETHDALRAILAARAALGAPEGQPPAPQRYLGNDVTCSDATVAAPQELLGKEGARTARPYAATNEEREDGRGPWGWVAPLRLDVHGHVAHLGDGRGGMRCGADIPGQIHAVDLCPDCKSSTTSAPPRKAPQEDALRAENARLENERAEWQESAEAYCDHAGRRFNLLERINAACGRALAGDHDKASMLATLTLCAGLAADRHGRQLAKNERRAARSAPKSRATTKKEG